VTAQDVSTMLRYGQKTIIFLINNGGYTIEVEIHDGPYNVIKNWNYTGLVDAIHNGEGNCWTTKVIKIINSLHSSQNCIFVSHEAHAQTLDTGHNTDT
jgi:TPP-dependent 2-oxoacid decarboxylase